MKPIITIKTVRKRLFKSVALILLLSVSAAGLTACENIGSMVARSFFENIKTALTAEETPAPEDGADSGDPSQAAEASTAAASVAPSAAATARPAVTTTARPAVTTTTRAATTTARPTTTTTVPDSEFTPLRPVDRTALEDAIDAAISEYNYIDEMMGDVDEEIDYSSYDGDFEAANDLFKAGDYSDAEAAYLDILDEYPVHLGARNNYVLTLAHTGEYEEALMNSVLLGLIHPDYEGNWVNILIPLYALGYDDPSYSDAISNTAFPSDAGLEGDMNDGSYTDEISEAYAYNRAYADMEAAYGDRELENKMGELGDILQSLKDQSPNDTDYTKLIEYLEALETIRTK